jgi:hypothetical protein
MKLRFVLIGLLVLAVGAAIGWLVGRWELERRWAEPVVIGAADAARSSEGDADPTPPAGTEVLAPMPILRARAALRAVVAEDPVRLRVGSIGRSDGEMFLHLTLENHGDCTVREVEGGAYGFDARGMPARLNRAGEQYVAFHASDLALAPGAHENYEWPLHHPHAASLALAQVERVGCADGTQWERP